MAWSFGDGFDLYATSTDSYQGYWDSSPSNFSIVGNPGRFAGSRAVAFSGSSLAGLVKASNVNDAVHHFCLAIQQPGALSGSANATFIQIRDGTTAQCSIVFRQDGAILLTSGIQSGTTLATYTGALTAVSTWYQFEIEVIINSVTGSIKIRKNGNSVDDFSATALNTRGGTANNYANAIGLGDATAVTQYVDDFFWRSDASSVAWMGDIRCQTRMPASDSTVTWARTPTTNVQSTTGAGSQAVTNGSARYAPYTASFDGTVATVTITLNTGYTGNMKCSMFASSGGVPTTVLGSATTITNPATGVNTFTFGTPVTMIKGTLYFIGVCSDTTSGNWAVAAGTTGFQTSTPYASFPVASPASPSAVGALTSSITMTVTTNNSVVSEAQQDATTSYVYSANVNDADLYGISTIPVAPTSVIAVTTRSYLQKSDAGTRTAAVQVKSGATTVASPTLTLTTSGWQWAWRTDVTDPNTGAAWTPTAVNNMTVGPKVIA